MSEIKSFSDYTSKYNSNVDFSALFSGMSDSSSVGNTNMLSDYAAIKNGSYGKLMKAYYAKQDAEKLSGKGDTSQKLLISDITPASFPNYKRISIGVYTTDCPLSDAGFVIVSAVSVLTSALSDASVVVSAFSCVFSAFCV